MISLSTHYLGFGLKNPLVVSSSPLTENIDNIRQMEDVGAAAIVLPSFFEEQMSMEQTQSKYLDHIRKTKEAVSIPVIASLNVTYTGSWVGYANKMQQAGADAIELNIYYLPTDPDVSGVEIENRYLDTLWDVTAKISIPIAVKLNPYFSSIGDDDVVVPLPQPVLILLRIDRANRDVDAEPLQRRLVEQDEALRCRIVDQELDAELLALGVHQPRVLHLPAGLFQKPERLAHVAPHLLRIAALRIGEGWVKTRPGLVLTALRIRAPGFGQPRTHSGFE